MSPERRRAARRLGWRAALSLVAGVCAAWAATHPAPAAAGTAPEASAPVSITAPPGLDEFAHLELDNGLRVLLGKPQRAALLSEVLLVVRAGTGPEKTGPGEAAWIAAEALLAGRVPDGTQEVRHRLAQIGVSVDHTVGKEATVFRFTAPTRKTDELLRLLGDLLVRREVAPETWARAAAQRRLTLAQQRNDPWLRSTALLDELLWNEPSAPGVPVAAAAPEDPVLERAEGIFRRAYVPGQAVLSVWGEAEVDALARTVRAELGPAPRSVEPPVEVVPLIDPSPRSEGTVRCLQQPGATPPALLIGISAEIDDDVAFYGWQILAHILGASHDSRLHRRLRLREGLAYTVEASCLPVGEHGLTLRIATQAPNVERTHQVILEELRRLATEEVSQEELDLARSIFRSRLLLDQTSFREQFYRRALTLLSTRTVRNSEDGERALAALTPARLLALTRQTLRPQRASVVVIAETAPALCSDAGAETAR